MSARCVSYTVHWDIRVEVSVGPEYYLPAAMCFYRALRVYPSPVELIVIYEKTMPEPVFKVVLHVTLPLPAFVR